MKNTPTSSLYQAVLSLKTTEEIEDFFRDLLTTGEIQEFARRWQTAQMLDQKKSYTEIEKATGMSSTTIARVSKFLRGTFGGYRTALQRTNITPVSPS